MKNNIVNFSEKSDGGIINLGDQETLLDIVSDKGKRFKGYTSKVAEYIEEIENNMGPLLARVQKEQARQMVKH